jgi:uncharacterized phage protein (TIGR02216 family)
MQRVVTVPVLQRVTSLRSRRAAPGIRDVHMQPFPWKDAIGFGLGVLRLPPDAFWRMTPRELAAAIEAVRGRVVAPLDRGHFEDLMRRFPDER